MSERIVTVTLNPALDLTIGLETLTPGDVHRAETTQTNAGGKGVNVASCLADWGLNTAATGLLGHDNAAPFENLFRDKGIKDAMLRLPGSTRTNVKLTEAGGRTTDINLPGLPTTSDDLIHLRATLQRLSPTLLVLAGSLPEGMGDAVWADLTAEWRERGARIVLDVSGKPLAVALAQPKTRPHVLKPNRDELSMLAGEPLDDAGLLHQARRLQASGIDLVVVSMGGHGALFVSASGAVHAAPLAVDVLSSVGAGDAMVAGLTAAMAEDGDLAESAKLERVARLATAFAAGKLRVVGPHLPSREAVEALAARVQLKSADDWIGAGHDAA